jgi:2-keto-4-pentenoate hydratase/2-oxohepta-3-ene-1,7-dioic acid hydratase in catechol pathway
LQFGDGQWTRGKSLDTFAPLGPFITTRDEIDDVQTLKIEGVLNGEVMQSSNTSRMIFKVAYLVSYLSQGITLRSGDVIASGTPDGVGIFRKPPVLLARRCLRRKIEKVDVAQSGRGCGLTYRRLSSLRVFRHPAVKLTDSSFT